MEKLLDKFLEMTERVIKLEVENKRLSDENESINTKLKECVEIARIIECLDTYSSGSSLYVKEDEKLKKLLKMDNEVKADD